MRAYAGIFVIITLLLLVGIVGALGIPDTLTITSDKSYLTANGVDQSTISVTVWNTTTYSGPVKGAAIIFSVLDPSLGTFTPVNVTSDINGKATSSFKVNTKSGTAVIKADVYYSDSTGSYSNFTTYSQKIDHDKAHFAIFTHPIDGNVSEKVPFNISFTDYYGNPIDQKINPGQQHTINLHIHGPSPDDAGFFINSTGYGHDITALPLDKNGNVSLMVQLSQGAGPNSVTMDSFEEIVTPVPRIITSISTEVSAMEQLFIPDSPAQVPADGINKFSIQYTLFDKFGNPVSQQWAWVNTSIGGEDTKFKSDSLGRILITYGPRVTIGIINITATSVSNSSVSKSHLVEFTSTAPTDMVLTANPEYVPSRDVSGTSSTTITATITDISGNPVDNETVTFSNGTAEYGGVSYIVTSQPSLTPPYTVKTDADGHATVQFIPGGFSTNKTAPNYDSTATGTCTITATWVSTATGLTTTKDILVTWKNYPYLSVTTSVNPTTVEVNNTVDVTINLKADGWFMQPDPIDVILVMDRSGSMDDAMTGHTQLYYAKIAAKTFVTQMNQSRDQIGVVSYAGYTSGTGTRTDIALSHSRTGVNTAIDSLNAQGATETREALKRSIDLLKASPNPNPNAKQAIILMTDGDYNWKGNPLGRGTARDSSYSYSTNTLEPNNFLWYSGRGCSLGSTSCQLTEQNMSVYAKNNNIRLYMISFAQTLDPQAVSDMRVMANATGGFYQHAPDAATLNQIYTKIAGELNDKAGVNTTMNTDFQNVIVNNATIPGGNVYDYIYNATASTKIKWQDGVTNVTNQSNDWNADKKLDFNIGTMRVGQTWDATFRLKVKESGIIDVFGPDSILLFNGTEPLTLPHTFFYSVPSLNATGFEPVTIDVISSCPAQAPQSFILPIVWTTTYTGPANTIDEVVLYISESGAHVPFFTASYSVTGDTLTTRSAQFDLRTVPPGKYAFQIVTNAGSAIATSQSCGNYTVSTKGVTFLKLE
jgi:hypothetical protein